MDVDTNQPLGTPTWIELAVPDLDAGLEFYRAVFGWESRSDPQEYGGYTNFLLRDRPVAGILRTADAQPSAWTVSLATPDVDETVLRARQAGGTVLVEPVDVLAQGRTAQLRDPVGARFALWQGRDHVGCQVVNEPGSLVRNDLVTPTPGPAREFYAAIFDFTVDRNEDMPDIDFTSCAVPTGTRWAASWARPEPRRRPGTPPSRSPAPTTWSSGRSTREAAARVWRSSATAASPPSRIRSARSSR